MVAAGIREGGGHALPVRADCTVEADVERAVRTVTEQLGAPSIVAAFAGGSGAPVPTVEKSAAHWREVLETNLTSTFLTVKAFLLAMIERRGGSIITMSSAAARQPARSNAA